MPFQQMICQLIQEYRNDSSNFLHERELHALFFGLCRGCFGRSETTDQYSIELFRYEYETIWRYKKTAATTPYQQRYPEKGGNVSGATTGAIDFVLLLKGFVQQHDLITVINKFEPARARLRPPADIPWPSGQCSVAFEAAVEFKMAHRQKKLAISKGEINQFHKAMVDDARKLARERVPFAFVVGFSHGPLPAREKAAQIVCDCMREFQSYYDASSKNGTIRIAIVTPTQSYFSANWSHPISSGEAVIISC